MFGQRKHRDRDDVLDEAIMNTRLQAAYPWFGPINWLTMLWMRKLDRDLDQELQRQRKRRDAGRSEPLVRSYADVRRLRRLLRSEYAEDDPRR